ncbi:hypothetical protein BGZ83_006792 [Gryganskiella cystojenkinii]|nr:hypothetical protein BGZ83_006792 [Gryganskiella cystojenkinii]
MSSIMALNRHHFICLLYEVFVFEYAAIYEAETLIPFGWIATCFDIVCQIYEDFDNLTIPCDIFIPKNGYNDADCIGDLISDHELELLPCFEDSVEDNYSDDDDNSNIHYSGYRLDKNGVILPNWDKNDEQDFLWNYTRKVPHGYKDDIAVLIHEVRERHWNHAGSGGPSSTVYDDLIGVTKYTRERSEQKLGIPTQRKLCEIERLNQKQLQKHQRQQERFLAQEQLRILEERQARQAKEERDRLEASLRARITNEAKIQTYMNSLAQSIASSEAREYEIWSLRGRLEGQLCEYFGVVLDVVLYGSFFTGLSTKDSDADFTVMDNDAGIDSVQDIADALNRYGYQNVITIYDARIPIVRFYDPSTATACDISLDNTLAEMNSKLIKTYQQIDNRFRPLWFSIRQIAKRHGILSGSQGYLSSYALLLMMITFLQGRSPPILPVLQKQPDRRMVNATVDDWDCSFDRNWSNYRGLARENTQTLSDLLMEFCRYFGHCYNYTAWEADAAEGGILARSSYFAQNNAQKRKLMNAPICIKDPFERCRNVAGNCNKNRTDEIRTVFQVASDALARGDINVAFKR